MCGKSAREIDKVVSLTLQPLFPAGDISGTHFGWSMIRRRVKVRPEGIYK